MADEEERTGPDLLEQMALDGECPGALILVLQAERDALQREVTKQGQRATKAEHNCESARALAEQSLKRWVALEAEWALKVWGKEKPKAGKFFAVYGRWDAEPTLCRMGDDGPEHSMFNVAIDHGQWATGGASLESELDFQYGALWHYVRDPPDWEALGKNACTEKS